MINLLPPEVKQDYRYARLNYRLRRWAAAFALGLIGMVVITFTGVHLMQSSATISRRQITQARAQLASEHYNQTTHQVAQVSRNLRLMVKVLGREVLFSKLLGRLGAITPHGAKLTKLSISQSQSAIDITAETTGYGAASQLEANLADPANRVFARADLVSVACKSSGGDHNGGKGYPCTATIRALLAGNSPFLFINSQKGGAPS
jgi:hypothetical protein